MLLSDPEVTSSGQISRFTAEHSSPEPSFPHWVSSLLPWLPHFHLENLATPTLYYVCCSFMFCYPVGSKSTWRSKQEDPPAMCTPGSIVEKLHLTLNCRDLFRTRKGNPREQLFWIWASQPHPLLEQLAYLLLLSPSNKQGSPASSALATEQDNDTVHLGDCHPPREHLLPEKQVRQTIVVLEPRGQGRPCCCLDILCINSSGTWYMLRIVLSDSYSSRLTPMWEGLILSPFSTVIMRIISLMPCSW